MLKITYMVSTMCEGGGVEHFLQNVVREAQTRGWKPQILVLGLYDSTFVERLRREGVTVDCLSQKPVKDTFFNLLRQYPTLKRTLRVRERTIVHLNTCSHSVVLPVHCLKRLGYKIRIVHSHTSPAKNMSLLRRLRYALVRAYLHGAATYMAACSKEAASFLFLPADIKSKVWIIANGVDTQKFKFNQKNRDELRMRLGWEDALVVGAVGRLEQEKNMEFLVRCFARVAQQEERARLLIVGDGTQKNELKAQAEKELGARAQKVCFAGYTENVEDYLCAMDVFVMPSLFEGMPMALLEAVCSGAACVVSKNVPELPCGGNVIRLGLEEKTEIWAQAILNAPQQQGERDAAYQRLEGTADIAAMSGRLAQLYRQATEEACGK